MLLLLRIRREADPSARALMNSAAAACGSPPASYSSAAACHTAWSSLAARLPADVAWQRLVMKVCWTKGGRVWETEDSAL